MFEQSPVTVYSSRAMVHRTPFGGDCVQHGDPRGSVVVGQSGDVSMAMAGGVVLTVWPSGTVTMATPNTDGDDGEHDDSAQPTGITFELPDIDTIGKGVTALTVRSL